MHAHGTAPSTSPSPTPAILLALALLGMMAAGGTQVVQQVRMAPGTIITAPVDDAPQTRLPDARPNGTAHALRSEGPGWETLNTPQKLALYPLAGRWALLSTLQKRRWLALAQTFPALPEEEQARLHNRMTEWASLSAQQRNQARLNFAITNRLAPDDKRTQWDAYQALSDEDKRMLAARAAAKPQGAATALRPVSPKKLAKVPAAINAPGNPANPPKVPPPSHAPARISAPSMAESRGAEAADAATLATPTASSPAATASTPSAAPVPAPAAPSPSDALPANPYVN